MARGRLPVGAIATIIILGTCGLAFLFPIYWLFVGSLKTLEEIYTFPPSLIPLKPQFANYAQAWQMVDFPRLIFNSLFMTSSIVLLQLVLSCMAAYAYAKMKFFGKSFFFFLTVSCLVVPAQVRFVPLYIMFSKIGWINTFFALILPFAGSAFAIFFIRQAFMTVDNALIDAVKMEGASVLQIIWHVMIPCSKTALLALSLFSFIAHWNDFFWPLIMTSSDRMHTLSVGLGRMARASDEFIRSWHHIMAANVVFVGPIVLLFVIIQKQIINSFSFVITK